MATRRKVSSPGRMEKSLITLLVQPRTREGLIALGRGHGLTEHFIYGWISNAVRIGTVIKHKAGGQVTYSLSSGVVEEKVEPSVYPPWLDPRTLPVARSRAMYVDGVPLKQKEA